MSSHLRGGLKSCPSTGFVHYLALTFKHAVEFSSFGCVPRFSLSTFPWGNSSYFTGADPRSQIRFPASVPSSWLLTRLWWVLIWTHTVPASQPLGWGGRTVRAAAPRRRSSCLLSSRPVLRRLREHYACVTGPSTPAGVSVVTSRVTACQVRCSESYVSGARRCTAISGHPYPTLTSAVHPPTSTAPTVFFPRRSTTNRPARRSSPLSRCSGSVTLALFT